MICLNASCIYKQSNIKFCIVNPSCILQHIIHANFMLQSFEQLYPPFIFNDIEYPFAFSSRQLKQECTNLEYETTYICLILKLYLVFYVSCLSWVAKNNSVPSFFENQYL